MLLYGRPYFVNEDDPRQLPRLLEGDPERDRASEYEALFMGEPCWAPVLAATIFTADSNGIAEILVAVRDPETNITHPNVVSTPTRRLTPEAFALAAAAVPVIEQTPRRHKFLIDRGWRRSTSDADNDWTGIQWEIDMLLQDKLGVPFGGRNSTVLGYRPAQHAVTLGNSRVGVDEYGRDVIEKVAMLNVLVQTTTSQKELFAESTEHYRDIRWVSPDQYRDMQARKNLLPVFDEMAAELCIHGVCIATSRSALDDMESLIRLASSR